MLVDFHDSQRIARRVSQRKHISLKTRCASLIIQCGLIPYDDAKLMTDDQIISLTVVDHNILHETGHPDRDRAYNLTHMLIQAHRKKTKLDAKVVAKGKRIRAWKLVGFATADGMIHEIKPRRLKSRGFDRTKTRGFDGKVRERRK